MTENSVKLNVDVFNRDAKNHGGYLYTTDIRLSNKLATQRKMDVVLQMSNFAGRSILDMAWGDGFYTISFWDFGKPRVMIGVDAAKQAIEAANINKRNRSIQFVVGDVHRLPWPDNSFGSVLIQSVLHHDNNPLGVIREAFRLAPKIIIHEPNGNNLGLKIIEKLSHYHREHQEKSYTSYQMRNWIRNAGGEVTYERFAGFVPMFCPDWLARMMKAVEPVVEHLPVVNALGCAVIVLVAVRNE